MQSVGEANISYLSKYTQDVQEVVCLLIGLRKEAEGNGRYSVLTPCFEQDDEEGLTILFTCQ